MCVPQLWEEKNSDNDEVTSGFGLLFIVPVTILITLYFRLCFSMMPLFFFLFVINPILKQFYQVISIINKIEHLLRGINMNLKLNIFEKNKKIIYIYSKVMWK